MPKVVDMSDIGKYIDQDDLEETVDKIIQLIKSEE